MVWVNNIGRCVIIVGRQQCYLFYLLYLILNVFEWNCETTNLYNNLTFWKLFIYLSGLCVLHWAGFHVVPILLLVFVMMTRFSGSALVRMIKCTSNICQWNTFKELNQWIPFGNTETISSKPKHGKIQILQTNEKDYTDIAHWQCNTIINSEWVFAEKKVLHRDIHLFQM